ncbi:MAG: hypothetical protein OSB45_11510 [Pseudomonadales bacterium]|jgi:hypothetical protein|nr:hypothetical protein [Pseudomonadales bacterium]
MAGELHINDIVDFHAYPLASTDAKARQRLVDPFKAQLDQEQYCAVPGFVRPKALSLMTAEAMAVRPFAFDNNSRRNVYLQRQPDPALPEDHPRNLFAATSTRMIAYDQIPKRSPLKPFYHSAEVRNFIADIVGIQALYDNEDPYLPTPHIYTSSNILGVFEL